MDWGGLCLVHESQDLASVGQHDVWKLSLNIYIHSRNCPGKSPYNHYVLLLPCVLTHVCVNRDICFLSTGSCQRLVHSWQCGLRNWWYASEWSDSIILVYRFCVVLWFRCIIKSNGSLFILFSFFPRLFIQEDIWNRVKCDQYLSQGFQRISRRATHFISLCMKYRATFLQDFQEHIVEMYTTMYTIMYTTMYTIMYTTM